MRESPTKPEGAVLGRKEDRESLEAAAAINMLGAVLTREIPTLSAVLGIISGVEGAGSGVLTAHAVYVSNQE